VKIQLIIVAAFAITAAFGQSNLGSIQGTVVGSDGTPLPGTVFAAVKAANQKAKLPPTLAASVAGGAIARSGGKTPLQAAASTFLVCRLPAGAYILCAQTLVAGWLDPCHWSANVPVVNLAAGQNLIGQTVVMTKGAVFQIRINDPSKALSTQLGPIPQDVEVIALGSNNAYYNARVASTDAGGRKPATDTALRCAPHANRSQQATYAGGLDRRGDPLGWPLPSRTDPLRRRITPAYLHGPGEVPLMRTMQTRVKRKRKAGTK